MRLHSLPQASSTPRVPHMGKYDTFSGPGHSLTWRIIDDVQVAVSAALVRGHVTPESNRISAISITFTLRRPRKIQSRKRSKGPPVHVAVMCDSVSVSRPPSRTPVKKGGGCHPGLLELPTATQTIRGQVNNDQFGEIVDTPVSRDEDDPDQSMRRWAAHQTGAVQGHTCVCANAIKLWKGSGARSSNVASAPRHKFGPATHLVKYLFTKDVSIKPRKVNGGARANPSPAFDMSDEQGRSVE
ncbi:hypothetical protein B2J93_4596 [Marssonina coronariae]|uniref:Uncharacterized protein n=1 Tax=Diplocarpon coronariae TaxID=2795749 RepID=A0A218Z2W3_9HELO|nr:hypothetical protein B2J93_4596 [Marssonina coronariae]